MLADGQRFGVRRLLVATCSLARWRDSRVQLRVRDDPNGILALGFYRITACSVLVGSNDHSWAGAVARDDVPEATWAPVATFCYGCQGSFEFREPLCGRTRWTMPHLAPEYTRIMYARLQLVPLDMHAHLQLDPGRM